MGAYSNSVSEKVKLRESALKLLSKKPPVEKVKFRDKVTVSLSKLPYEKIKLRETITRRYQSSRPTTETVNLHESSIITPNYGLRSLTEMWYGGYKFLPAPLISVSREIVRSGIDDILYIRTTISCNGALVTMTAPKTFGKLDVDQFVQLKAALAVDNERLVILHEDGAFVQNVFPRIENFKTEEAVWVGKIRYSFDFIYEELVTGSADIVDSFSDDWQFSQGADGRIQLSHNVAAKVKLSPTDLSDKEKEDSVILSRDYCNKKAGLTNIPRGLLSSVLTYLKQFSAYSGQTLINSQLNLTSKNESVNAADGSYSLAETYELASNNEQVSISISIDENRIVTVTVSGEVQGAGGTREIKSASMISLLATAVNAAYDLGTAEYIKQGFTLTLNKQFSSKSVTINKSAFSASYSLSFTDKTSTEGIISEEYNISDKRPVQSIVLIPIPGRDERAPHPEFRDSYKWRVHNFGNHRWSNVRRGNCARYRYNR